MNHSVWQRGRAKWRVALSLPWRVTLLQLQNGLPLLSPPVTKHRQMNHGSPLMLCLSHNLHPASQRRRSHSCSSGSRSALHQWLFSLKKNCHTKEQRLKYTFRNFILKFSFGRCYISDAFMEPLSNAGRFLWRQSLPHKKWAAKPAEYGGTSDFILRQPYVTRERVSVLILLEGRVAWTGNKTQFASSVPSF